MVFRSLFFGCSAGDFHWRRGKARDGQIPKYPFAIFLVAAGAGSARAGGAFGYQCHAPGPGSAGLHRNGLLKRRHGCNGGRSHGRLGFHIAAAGNSGLPGQMLPIFFVKMKIYRCLGKADSWKNSPEALKNRYLSLYVLNKSIRDPLHNLFFCFPHPIKSTSYKREFVGNWGYAEAP